MFCKCTVYMLYVFCTFTVYLVQQFIFLLQFPAPPEVTNVVGCLEDWILDLMVWGLNFGRNYQRVNSGFGKYFEFPSKNEILNQMVWGSNFILVQP